MKINSVVRFADERIKSAFADLEYGGFSEKKLHKELTIAISTIGNNAFCGVQIPKKLIPKQYKKKYTISNLWKFNLSNGWRLLYALESDEVVVVSIIVEWCSHKEYERIFKY